MWPSMITCCRDIHMSRHVLVLHAPLMSRKEIICLRCMKCNERSVAALYVVQVHRSLLCLDPVGAM